MATQITHKVGDVLENGKVVSEVDEKGRVLVVAKAANGNGKAQQPVGVSPSASAKAAKAAKRAARKAAKAAPAVNAKAVAEKLEAAKPRVVIQGGRQVVVRDVKAQPKPAAKDIRGPIVAAKPEAERKPAERPEAKRSPKDLTEAQVAKAREMRKAGESCRAIAEKFGLSPESAWRLVNPKKFAAQQEREAAKAEERKAETERRRAERAKAAKAKAAAKTQTVRAAAPARRSAKAKK